jgi:hypothetical protein
MPDWTAGENRWREEHYGESIYDRPADLHARLVDDEELAEQIISAALTEAMETQDDPPERRAFIDYDVPGEQILIRRIAAALRAARAA